MVRRLAVPLLLLLAAVAVGIVPALRGDAQEAPPPPEVEELPLEPEPAPPAPAPEETVPPDVTEPPETTAPPESSTLTPPPLPTAPPAPETLVPGWQEEAAVDANLIAVEWSGDPGAEFAIEVQGADGGWRRAGDIGAQDNGPDPGTPEGDAAAALPATNVSEPLWTDDVSVVRVTLVAGTAAGVTLVAIDSPPVGGPIVEELEQASMAAYGLLAAAGAAVVVAFVSGRRRVLAVCVLAAVVAVGCAPVKTPGPAPGASIPGSIVSRSTWGGDLPWNTGGHACDTSSPQIASGIGRAVVHHTVNSNDYGPDQSVQVLRGIWAHHAQVNGWCDIGYNFLIDRFGTVYEGRRGGIDKAVIGAHAAGANTGTTGIALVGDHRSVPVPAASEGSMINLIAWKFRVHLTNPQPGSIIGHLQVNQTECPGAQAVALLPMFRDQVRQRVPWNRSPVGHLDSVTREGNDVRVRGWALDPDTASSIGVSISIDGKPPVQVVANKPRSDIAASYPYNGGNHGFDHKFVGAGPGGHKVCVTALNHTAGGSNVSVGCGNVA